MHMNANQEQMMTMREMLSAYGIPHEVKSVARLARTLHRRAIHLRNTHQSFYVGKARLMQRDASDLLDYARELKLRHAVNF
jgi:hypothetical protein